MGKLGELSDKLDRVAEQISSFEQQKRRLAALHTEHQAAESQAGKLRRQLAKEERDVAQFEGVSLTALLVTLFGDRDARLMKERQEAVAAQLKYDEAARRARILAIEIEQVQAQLQPHAELVQRHKELLAEKETAMGASGQPTAAELFRISERNQELRQQAKEIGEALQAGLNADSALAAVEGSLSSAAGFGTWDMLGGGMIATALKHSRLDAAKSAAGRAQHALSAFARELRDVHLDLNLPQVGIEGFARFADFFFDNLLTDWVIQNRIKDSLSSVQQTRQVVAGLLGTLRERQSKATSELEAVTRQRAEFVERYRP